MNSHTYSCGIKILADQACLKFDDHDIHGLNNRYQNKKKILHLMAKKSKLHIRSFGNQTTNCPSVSTNTYGNLFYQIISSQYRKSQTKIYCHEKLKLLHIYSITLRDPKLTRMNLDCYEQLFRDSSLISTDLPLNIIDGAEYLNYFSYFGTLNKVIFSCNQSLTPIYVKLNRYSGIGEAQIDLANISALEGTKLEFGWLTPGEQRESLDVTSRKRFGKKMIQQMPPKIVSMHHKFWQKNSTHGKISPTELKNGIMICTGN